MRIGHVIVPAEDLDAQLAFYGELGLTTRFRDGDRYAAVTDGTVTLGLADETQQPLAGRTMVSIEVDDLDACIARLGAAGTAAGDPVVGPHERRVVVTDPSGNPVALYERTT
ncbi:VOC family protein [Nocardioides nitrophenolicus]|uniref:VOC family protein n=1 Tax=Nocardioides nitrophenolicus TaxID=60489 RepID=UPI00195608C5|nr:VOC family protein [Nocardioides nitrophenolicus]MBM7517467.1 putative enzyme related to lactoylglutathione lyase [Nocardioides nitrophenolicus]